MRYLSPEWFAAAAEAIQRDEQLRELCAEVDLTIEQTVTDGGEQPIRWHVVLDHGSAHLVVGPAPEADLRFRAPYPVARDIAMGELAAPIAFIRGDLRVGGDLSLLTVHNKTLAALGDVLRDVRRATSFS
ncbi:MAG TPA: SCP2 sterol-binding domain-containing protein [Acidimicrobiales bacterium]